MFTHRSIDVFYKLISTLCFSGNTSSPKQRNCKLLPATFIQISGELYLIHVVFLCSEWYDTKQKKFNLKQNKQQLNQRFFYNGQRDFFNMYWLPMSVFKWISSFTLPIYLHMHVNKRKFGRNNSLEYYHMTWNRYTKKYQLKNKIPKRLLIKKQITFISYEQLFRVLKYKNLLIWNLLMKRILPKIFSRK